MSSDTIIKIKIMKTKIAIIITALLSIIMLNAQSKKDKNSQNNELTTSPFVDYDAFEALVKEVKQHRAERLITLDDFLEKSKEANTIILDTRSKEMYDLKHVKGAVHLNFSDFTQFTLDALMNEYAGKNTQILIYCNNNFEDVGNTVMANNVAVLDVDPAFMTKSFVPSEVLEIKSELPPVNQLTLALNIPTYINLYGYGYTNVYELGELIDVKDTRIAFEGTFDDAQ